MEKIQAKVESGEATEQEKTLWEKLKARYNDAKEIGRVGAKALVLDALKKFNRESGVTVVMISSELEELRSTADRIAIVSGGKISGILPATSSVEELGMLMLKGVI